ncbi:RNA-directed DNA polymerase [Mycobacterium avium]|uniref:RNA-directed DNA polymerase n=1 Tax=Mycobacterium avium TaxID=1764 RepID=UPI001E289B0E|nr:RNA-directed DNA polymerase [Mycobacterium avium]UGU18831.1 RNA-directed DNA polymerase [Mycobacterium avium subsp. avium]
MAAIIATRAREGSVGNQPAPVLAASKWRHGRRPAAALPLPERVLYRAATSLLADGLAPERAKDGYSTMVSAPVENGDKFIVVTDLANYYSSIQVDRIANVLLSRTGEWSVIAWLSGFLQAISPDVGGLPQGNFASDRLADTYADTLLRRLRRCGLTAWHHSDDFRIGASSYQEGINALEIFDEELRSLGLFVNERKTYIVNRDKYIEHMERERQYFTDAWREKRDELTTVDFYSFEPITPEDPEVFAAVAMEELQAWAAAAKSVREDDKAAMPTRLDLSLVLNLLSLVREPEALEHVPELLLMEPQLTYQVAGYLYELSETHAKGVDDAVATTIKNTALSRWISVWLCYALSNPDRERIWAGRLALHPEVEGWLAAQTSVQDEVLASHAVWSLAATGSLARDAWSRLNQLPGSYSSQFAAAALAGLPVADRDSLDSGDRFDKIIRNWAESIL